MQLFKKLNDGRAVTRARQAESGMRSGILLTENKKDSGETDKLSAVPPAGAAAFDTPSSRGATETVEVSASAAALTAEPSTENGLMARSGAPTMEKTKPAPQTETSQLQNTFSTATVQPPLQGRNMMAMAKLESPASQKPTQPVTWAITTGVLQRSLDGGQSWQKALRADHPLLCYASHDEDVWSGGQAGTLFHSADSGTTWAQVQPSIKGQQLSSDITHIDATQIDEGGPAKIVVSTSNNEIWSSADGGKTWDKK
jgi:hypothetical protein